jgi:hypothetical protein
MLALLTRPLTVSAMDTNAQGCRALATVDKSIVADPLAFKQLLHTIERLPQTRLNLSSRLAKYGIISVITAPNMIDSIASLPGIKAVQEDELRQAL